MDTIFSQMSVVIGSSAQEGTAEAAEYAKKVLEENKEILHEIKDLYQADELTLAEFESELNDQKESLEAQMLVGIIIGKVAMQKAMDSALDILKKTTIGQCHKYKE